MIFLFWQVSRELKQQAGWHESLRQIKAAITGDQQWELFAMVLLMPVNWGLEAFKWQQIVTPIQPIRFRVAFRSIFAGACVSAFTPNRVGEYLGRMLYMDEGKKMQAVAPAIVCSMAQTLTTGIVGFAGLLLFLLVRFPYPVDWLTPYYVRIFLVITGGCTILLATLYFRFDPLAAQVNKLLKKYVKSFSIPEYFESRLLLKILLLSVIRYAVFLLQYFLLFSLFRVNVSALQVFMGVSVMFVVMAFVPSFTLLTDLGLRWEAGLRIFKAFTPNATGILAVSLGIWLVNLIIPALVGSLLILRIKLFRIK